MDLNEGKKEVEVKSEVHKESLITKKMRSNPWMISTIVLVILSLVLIFGGFSMNTSKISEQEAGELLVGFYEAQGISGLEVVMIKEENNFYKIDTEYQGQTIPFYVTKSGFLTGNSIISLIGEEEIEPVAQTQEIPKQDVPEIELFIMTECPYGTQAEKGILPVFEALGNSINAQIRFVHYFMHGDKEELETYTQLCIREEQSDKYYDYLECYLEDGDSERCLTKVGISNLDTCLANNAYYDSDSALSQGYGVQGSPTLIINGQKVDSSRSPAAYLDIICQSFTNAPEACGLELSSTNPSPGFGYGEGSASTASCS